jgi:hypothetical protein
MPKKVKVESKKCNGICKKEEEERSEKEEKER